MVGAGEDEIWDFISRDSETGEETVWDTFKGYAPFLAFQVCVKGCDSRSSETGDGESGVVEFGELSFAKCPPTSEGFTVFAFNETAEKIDVFGWNETTKVREFLFFLAPKSRKAYFAKNCLYLDADTKYEGEVTGAGSETLYKRSTGSVIAYFSENAQFEF